MFFFVSRERWASGPLWGQYFVTWGRLIFRLLLSSIMASCRGVGCKDVWEERTCVGVRVGCLFGSRLSFVVADTPPPRVYPIRTFSPSPSCTGVEFFHPRWLVLCFFVKCAASSVAIGSRRCVSRLKVMIMADPVLVLNFTMPWTVDGTAWNSKSDGYLRSMYVSDGWFTTKNSITLVILSFLSWLTRVRGRFMVPTGHNWWPVNLTSRHLVGCFNPSF